VQLNPTDKNIGSCIQSTLHCIIEDGAVIITAVRTSNHGNGY